MVHRYPSCLLLITIDTMLNSVNGDKRQGLKTLRVKDLKGCSRVTYLKRTDIEAIIIGGNLEFWIGWWETNQSDFNMDISIQVRVRAGLGKGFRHDCTTDTSETFLSTHIFTLVKPLPLTEIAEMPEFPNWEKTIKVVVICFRTRMMTSSRCGRLSS